MRRYEKLLFDNQVDFFRQKLELTVANWNELWRSQNDKATTVANAINACLLRDFQNAIDSMINQGMTIQMFNEIFNDLVSEHGWTNWLGGNTQIGRNCRSTVICEANLSTSYNAGRWQQSQQIKNEQPYLLYKHVPLGAEWKPRPLHVAWDGMVLPADHEWWKTHYPPNGFGCRCQVYSLSVSDLVLQGLSVTPDADIVPGEADDGWGSIT
jgi:uncharacterized protein with gpF-like domain